MRKLDEALALALIEQGQSLAPLDRAVLLASSFSKMSIGEAADLPLDRRDRLLIDVRQASFGSQVEIFACCPHCNEGHEADFDLSALPDAVPARAVTALVAGQELCLKAPTSRAVAAAVTANDPGLLAAACIEAGEVAVSEARAAEIEAALEEAYPLLAIEFDLSCSACERSFGTRFDIVAWLWAEIEALAERALDAVDRIARAYGWSEAAILGLSPARRALYLARVVA